jgi:hypothetical protein
MRRRLTPIAVMPTSPVDRATPVSAFGRRRTVGPDRSPSRDYAVGAAALSIIDHACIEPPGADTRTSAREAAPATPGGRLERILTAR